MAPVSEMQKYFDEHLASRLVCKFNAVVEQDLKTADLTNEQLLEQVCQRTREYLTKLAASTTLSPQVEVEVSGNVDDPTLTVDVKVPAHLIPPELLQHHIHAIVIRPRRGRLHRAVAVIPDQYRSEITRLSNKALRGWYVHSRKGKKVRRNHHRNNPVWFFNLGTSVSLRPTAGNKELAIT